MKTDEKTTNAAAFTRSALGVTQQQIAEDCGVHVETYAKWERNDHPPNAAARRLLLLLLFLHERGLLDTFRKWRGRREKSDR